MDKYDNHNYHENI